jgi:hypothetical protein
LGEAGHGDGAGGLDVSEAGGSGVVLGARCCERALEVAALVFKTRERGGALGLVGGDGVGAFFEGEQALGGVGQFVAGRFALTLEARAFEREAGAQLGDLFVVRPGGATTAGPAADTFSSAASR